MQSNLSFARIHKEVSKTKKSDRRKISLYMSVSAYQQFKGICGKISPCRIIESFMEKSLGEVRRGA